MNSVRRIAFSSLAVGVIATGCATGLPQRDLRPEQAKNQGYYLTIDQSNDRAAVNGYVPKICSQGGLFGLPAKDCSSQPAKVQAAKSSDQIQTTAAAPVRNAASIKLYFESGKNTLSAQERARLQTWIEQNSTGYESLSVKGFADARGKQASNEQLSKARASATAELIRSYGINADSAQAVGYGPVAGSAADASRAREARRVEITLE